MSLNKLIFGSYKCHQDHEHRTEVDMKECNDMEQKRREMEYKLEAQKLEDQRKRDIKKRWKHCSSI
ncbi:hypothetical protein MAR_006290 [Mya arenaria]|uniref:Uncharacterized protein n=1 Tax=Mya arenaria TaxID=6604 RepID=A0ABY7D7X5_MYAAR|nr:hypothetical protein MAR_006233 [Mya arenaria]WAQ93819.1 hypothetical protein MAR_006290 [Mya arenaria]